MNASVRRRLRRVVTTHASASARQRARERDFESRARLERNQSHARKTHSNAIARDRARRANDTRIDSFAPTRAFAFSATARDSKSIEMRNRMKFNSISIRCEILPRASRSRSLSSSRDARSVAHDVVRVVTPFERSRARTRATRADASAHLECGGRRDTSRVMTRQIPRAGIARGTWWRV